ncbi:MAG TPA: DUF5683 domain-containing protein [Leptospiraceae bacterium]|nr:DUF5683 domain-containing protein [Leptospiraceae bacterium]
MKTVFINFTVGIFIIFPVSADVMIFKSGREISNVRTFVGRGSVSVSFEDGRTETVSKRDLKKFRFETAIWKRNESAEGQHSEEERLSEQAKDGNEWVERPEDEKISPLGNAALGLIPGYSGLYRTENYSGGLGFTVIEIGLVGLLASYSVPAGNENSDAKAVRNSQLSTAAGGLGAVLLMDSMFSYYSAKNWNEGRYQGKKADPYARPTTVFSRFWRSALIPGWGQVYAGNTVKGGFFLGIAGLLGAGILSLNPVRNNAEEKVKNNENMVMYALTAPSSSSSAGLLRISFNQYNSSKVELDSRKEEESMILSGIALLWMLNIADAVFFSGKKAEETAEKRLIFQPEFRMNRVMNAGLETNIGGRISWNW